MMTRFEADVPQEKSGRKQNVWRLRKEEQLDADSLNAHYSLSLSPRPLKSMVSQLFLYIVLVYGRCDMHALCISDGAGY